MLFTNTIYFGPAPIAAANQPRWSSQMKTEKDQLHTRLPPRSPKPQNMTRPWLKAQPARSHCLANTTPILSSLCRKLAPNKASSAALPAKSEATLSRTAISIRYQGTYRKSTTLQMRMVGWAELCLMCLWSLAFFRQTSTACSMRRAMRRLVIGTLQMLVWTGIQPLTSGRTETLGGSHRQFPMTRTSRGTFGGKSAEVRWESSVCPGDPGSRCSYL